LVKRFGGQVGIAVLEITQVFLVMREYFLLVIQVLSIPPSTGRAPFVLVKDSSQGFYFPCRLSCHG